MDELVNTVQSMSKSTNDIDIKLPIVFDRMSRNT